MDETGPVMKTETMARIHRPDWTQIGRRIKDQIGKDRLHVIAAGVTFYGLLAIFPTLAALISIFGLAFDPDQMRRELDILGGMQPHPRQSSSSASCAT